MYDRIRSRRLSKERHFLRISAKGCDILLDPPQRQHLILDAEILFIHPRIMQKSQRTKAEIQIDDDKMSRPCQRSPVIPFQIPASVTVRASMQPYSDRKLFLQRRSAHGKRQTVFASRQLHRSHRQIQVRRSLRRDGTAPGSVIRRFPCIRLLGQLKS